MVCGDNEHFLDALLLNGMKMNYTEFRVAVNCVLAVLYLSTSEQYVQITLVKKVI